MIEAAIEAGLHVVVEKPWLCSAEETRRLQSLGEVLAMPCSPFTTNIAYWNTWKRGGANGVLRQG